jgi:hypothetical protein
MDTKSHHLLSFIPNRQILANKEIMNTLVKNMIDQENKFELKLGENKTNKIIEENIRQRNIDQR